MKPVWLENAPTFRRADEQYSRETYCGERPFFQGRRLTFLDCDFESGESALKETADIKVQSCRFRGKYPFWYASRIRIVDCEFSPDSRAGLWYATAVHLERCRIDAPKQLRECQGVMISHCAFTASPETGWHSTDVIARHCELAGPYLFFGARYLVIEDCIIDGPYAFQYAHQVILRRCEIRSKDVFWHAQNVKVEDCTVSTNYLGWHARNVSFNRCRLQGPQPLCRAHEITLRACRLDDADRAFEFSTIDAEIDGHIDSVLNPAAGRLVADSIGVLCQDDPRYQGTAQVSVRNQDCSVGIGLAG